MSFQCLESRFLTLFRHILYPFSLHKGISIAFKSNLTISYVSLGYKESIRKADFFAFYCPVGL
jgi:hypothetical protein